MSHAPANPSPRSSARPTRRRLVAFCAVLALVGQAHAQASKPAAKVSTDEAKAIALKTMPGKVTDVSIEKKLGKTVYVVEIMTPKDGERDVFVDMQTGEVLGSD